MAALLDTEAAVQGVTTGVVERELATVGLISKVGGGSVNPNAGELDVTAGWGHEGKVHAGQGQGGDAAVFG